MPNRPEILVVGSVNMDLAVHVTASPQPGQTVAGSNLTMTPGGKGANQAVAAARLGANVSIIARIGNDGFASTVRDNLAQNHVNTECLHISDDLPTGAALITVDNFGENSIIVAGGANLALTPDDLYGCEHKFEAADAVLLQLETPRPTVRAAIDLAKRHNCKIVLDPAPAVANIPDCLLEVDVLSPNHIEAEILTGKKADTDQTDKLVASMLIARGAKNVVLKLGRRGSLVVTEDGHFYRVPPFKVEVVDTTAAGDAFTAAYAVAMLTGQTLHEAARFANAAGALTCTKFGAQSAMPTEIELSMLLRDQPAH